jgi:hypothetical protein
MEFLIFPLLGIAAYAIYQNKENIIYANSFVPHPFSLYTVKYTGEEATIPEAFGDAWKVIKEIYVFSDNVWYAPDDPVNYILKKGEEIKFMVEATIWDGNEYIDYPVTISNFKLQ